MKGLSWNGVAIYLDGIIIGGTSFEKHLRILTNVLSRLKDAWLTIKSSKVQLCQKVEAVQRWPVLETPRMFAVLWDCVTITRSLLPDLQIIARPLNELSGTAKFEWTTEREESSCKLKKALSSAPLLAFPDMHRPFELSTDASDTGFGCISLATRRERSGETRQLLIQGIQRRHWAQLAH